MEWIKVQVLGSQNSVNASEELGAGRGELACEKRGHVGAVWIQHGTLAVAMSGDSNYGAFMDEVRRESQWCNQWSELAMQNSSYDIGNESFEPHMEICMATMNMQMMAVDYVMNYASSTSR